MAISSKLDLEKAIETQKIRVEQSKQDMIDQFQVTKENMKPVNLIRNTFQNVTGNSSLTSSLLKTGLGIGAAFLTKRLVTRGAGALAGKALGLAMNLGLVGAVTGPIKRKGLSLLKKLANRENGKAKH